MANGKQMQYSGSSKGGEREVKRKIGMKNLNSAKSDSISEKETKINMTKMGKGTKSLIEQYKIHNPNQLVPNSIDEAVLSELPYIEKCIESIKKYGNKNVYNLLPQELSDFISRYTPIVQESFVDSNKTMSTKPVMVVPEGYKKCTCCNKYKNVPTFYKNNAVGGDGLTNMCKSCIIELFNKFIDSYGIKEAIVLIFSKMDIELHGDILYSYLDMVETEKGKESLVNNVFLGNLIMDNHLGYGMNSDIDINHIGFANTHLGGIPFREVQKQVSIRPIYNDRLMPENYDSEEDEDAKELSDYQYKKLFRKWGIEDKNELSYIERCSIEWYKNYEVSGSNREVLVEQMCHEQLVLWRLRRNGGETTKALKNLQDMMRSADLTPKKAVSKNDNTNFTSLAEMIRSVETSRPFINKDSEFDDVDKIGKLIKGLSGFLARALSINCKEVKEAEELYKDSTVDVRSIVSEGNNE